MADEKSISTQALDHALAFRNNSDQLFSDAIEQVRTLSQSSQVLYPPLSFPSLRDPEQVSTIRLKPNSDFDGGLTQAEAAAMIVLLNETTALTQALGRDHKRTVKLKNILKLPNGSWDFDVVESLADFGKMLGFAARVRERILSGSGAPEEKTIRDRVNRSWWNIFETPVRMDGLKLGFNTTQAITTKIVEFAKRDFLTNPEGAKTPEQITNRIKSKQYGANLAANLYLESVVKASQILPNSFPEA